MKFLMLYILFFLTEFLNKINISLEWQYNIENEKLCVRHLKIFTIKTYTTYINSAHQKVYKYEMIRID